MNAIDIQNVSYSYGNRRALSCVSLRIEAGKLVSLLGPNGGGKSTLLNILCTLKFPQQGSVTYFGKKLSSNPTEIRNLIGVVFQNPALDKKLSVFENLVHHGQLYPISSRALKKRCEELLNFMSLADRRDEKVENLSGGLKRRVEIAKCLIHSPKLLILDEPTTGLDPIVRKDIWRDLKKQQELESTTILFTTHLLEEADTADRVAMLDQGKIVAEGSPSELKSLVGAETISIRCQDPQSVSAEVEKISGVRPVVVDNEVRLRSGGSADLASTLLKVFRDRFESLTLGKPTLEDLFLMKTGRKISSEAEA